jgi:hypothetical protein
MQYAPLKKEPVKIACAVSGETGGMGYISCRIDVRLYLPFRFFSCIIPPSWQTRKSF